MSLSRRAPLRPPTGRCSRGRRLSNFAGRARAHRTSRRSRPLRLRGASGRAPGRLPPPPTRGAFDRRGWATSRTPVAFGLWPAPPRPSSPVVYTETMRPPVLAADRPTAGVAGRRDARLRPGGLGRRRAPALAPRGDCPPVQYRCRVAPGTELTLRIPRRRRARLARHAAAQLCSGTSTGSTTPPKWTSSAAVDMADIDWRAIEALARILHVPLSFTVTQPSVFRRGRGSCRHHETGAATGACPDNTMSKLEQYGNRRPCHKLVSHGITHSPVVP